MLRLNNFKLIFPDHNVYEQKKPQSNKHLSILIKLYINFSLFRLLVLSQIQTLLHVHRLLVSPALHTQIPQNKLQLR